MKTKCPSCGEEVPRPLFAHEFSCSTCGATLRVENKEARQFVSTAEAVLIAIGFFASSSVVYAAIAVLMIGALALFVVWSLHSPTVVVKRGSKVT